MEKQVIFEDYFQQGLDVGSKSESRHWNYLEMGPVTIGQEGFLVTVGDSADLCDHGISVSPEARNPQTGEPMFTTTMPGQGDHMKWSVIVNQPIEVRADMTLNIEAELSGEQHGTHQHPFGGAVPDADDDVRLGVPLLMVVDFENMVVIDFALTNHGIYAIYERGKLMHEVSPQPAAYSFEIPLAKRQTADFHRLRIAYNPMDDSIAWYINDELVHEIHPLGMLTDRTFMYIDNGGQEQVVRPKSFSCGLGLLTLLDGAKQGGQALVNLTGGSDYYDPQHGPDRQVTFIDNEGRKENKLFGQGTTLRCRQFSIYYTKE